MLFGEAEVSVAATHLTQLDTVEAVKRREVIYIHLLLDQHDIILANGAWTESFQPADRSLTSMAEDHRAEIEALFPELALRDTAYPAARPGR